MYYAIAGWNFAASILNVDAPNGPDGISESIKDSISFASFSLFFFVSSVNFSDHHGSNISRRHFSSAMSHSSIFAGLSFAIAVTNFSKCSIEKRGNHLSFVTNDSNIFRIFSLAYSHKKGFVSFDVLPAYVCISLFTLLSKRLIVFPPSLLIILRITKSDLYSGVFGIVFTLP